MLMPFSLGIVAANKKLSSKKIEVILSEENPMYHGELTDNWEKYKAKGEDKDGESFEYELETTPSVVATWLPLGCPNRKTAPDVRRGEVVYIWKFADVDEYWWTTLLNTDTVRRLETVIWAFSNNREENNKDDAKSTYFFEISTHGKYIHLHTAKNDKEPFEYDVQINTKEGRITITDDDDNWIFLDSKDREIKLHNRDDSYVDINKREIFINAKDLVKITTDNFEVDAKKTIKTKTTDHSHKSNTYKNKNETYDNEGSTHTFKNSSFVIKSGSITTEVTGAYKLKSGDYNLTNSSYAVTAGSYKITTANAEFSGNTKVAGTSFAKKHG